MTTLNTKPQLVRTSVIVLISVLILFVVIQFAPVAQPPAESRGALTTRVAAVAATAIPPSPSPVPTQVALAPRPAPQGQDAIGTFFISNDREGYREL